MCTPVYAGRNQRKMLSVLPCLFPLYSFVSGYLTKVEDRLAVIKLWKSSLQSSGITGVCLATYGSTTGPFIDGPEKLVSSYSGVIRGPCLSLTQFKSDQRPWHKTPNSDVAGDKQGRTMLRSAWGPWHETSNSDIAGEKQRRTMLRYSMWKQYLKRLPKAQDTIQLTDRRTQN